MTLIYESTFFMISSSYYDDVTVSKFCSVKVMSFLM